MSIHYTSESLKRKLYTSTELLSEIHWTRTRFGDEYQWYPEACKHIAPTLDSLVEKFQVGTIGIEEVIHYVHANKRLRTSNDY